MAVIEINSLPLGVFGPTEADNNSIAVFDDGPIKIKSRKVTIDDNGNIALLADKTVDGVDISAHAVTADAHHNESHSLNLHNDITITSVTDNEILAYDFGTSKWINQTPSEAGIAASSHNHATGDIVSGTFVDARIAQSNITQHEGAIDHNALANFVGNKHIDWTAESAGTIHSSNYQTKTDLDSIDDVEVPSPSLNKVLKWNGTSWVPGTAGDTTEFSFSIATFTDNEVATQLIGTGTWESAGNISFAATYNNGPPDSASIALTSNGGVTWGSDLTLTSPFTSGVSTEDTAYPSTKDRYITFTLTATKDGSPDTDAETVYFRNYIYWGVASKNSGFTEADVEALANSAISNDQTRSMGLNPGVGEYMVFAFPSSYTSIPDGSDYETDGDTGFKFNSIACAFKSPETVSITNSAGFTEDYKVYASEQPNLGNHTLITTTSASTINPLYYGKTTKTDTFLESDVEGLANSEITNDNTQVWDSITTGAGEYMLFAFPKRLGTVTFWVGGFEGGFESPETVSVTNSNGWTEDYYVWRSTNSNLGPTVVTTT